MLDRIEVKIGVLLISLMLTGGLFFLSQKKISEGKILDNNRTIAGGIEVREKTDAEPIDLQPQEAIGATGKDIRVLFVGDLMFDRYIRQVARRKGNDFVFEKVDPMLQDADLAVANLEGPITDNPSVSENSEFGSKENYVFTFDPGVAATLKKHHVGLVSLGNNHMLNFKEVGAIQTEAYLQAAGVDFFGSPIAGAERMVVKNIEGIRIGLVNFNQFVFQGREKALEDIKKAKVISDMVIVYTHWGKEFETEPLENVRKLAHEFIDAGADAIIGSHPHVVQGKEVYKNKTIYYSLGNFIFDQYFQKETQEGLAVKLVINPETKGIVFQEIFLVMQNNGQTRPKGF